MDENIWAALFADAQANADRIDDEAPLTGIHAYLLNEIKELREQNTRIIQALLGY